jgi:nicotinamidase-related amidase
MSKKDTALLIVDMQNDFVLEDAPMRVNGALGIIGNTKKVLAEFRKKKLPIFHIVRIHRKDGSDIEITRKSIFSKTSFTVKGTKGAEIINALKPKKGEYVIKKIRMSAFWNTELNTILKFLDIKNIVIIGVQTPNCIRATAFDAVANSYNTYLVDDAIAAASKQIHENNVSDMKNIGIKLITTAKIKDILK